MYIYMYVMSISGSYQYFEYICVYIYTYVTCMIITTYLYIYNDMYVYTYMRTTLLDLCPVFLKVATSMRMCQTIAQWWTAFALNQPNQAN